MASIDARSSVVVPYPVVISDAARKDYVDITRHNFVLNTRTANYTATFGDEGKLIEMNATTSTVFTVPTNATVAFDIGVSMYVTRLGTGSVTIAAASGVTIRTANSLTMGAQYSTVWLRKRATDEWVLVAL